MHSYLFKICSSFLLLLYGIVIGILIPKYVGASKYGDFSYVVAAINLLVQVFLLEINSAYLNSGSKRRVDTVSYFFYLFFVSALVVFLVALSVNVPTLYARVWGVIDADIIYFSAALAFLMFFQVRVTEYADLTGIVRRNESLKLLSRLVIVVVVVWLVWSELLTLKNYLLCAIVVNIAYILWLFLAKTARHDFEGVVRLPDIMGTIHQFLVFSRYLVPVSIFTGVNAFLGKYFLQSDSGSIEQGYYAVGMGLSILPVAMITSLSTLITKEMFDLQNIARVYQFWYRTISFFHFVWFSVLFVFSDQIILRLVGEDFLGASSCLKVIAFFSFLHTSSTLNRCVLVAYGKKKMYSAVNIISLILGVAALFVYATYFSIDAYSLSLIVTSVFFVRVYVVKMFYVYSLRVFSWGDIVVGLSVYSLIFSLAWLVSGLGFMLFSSIGILALLLIPVFYLYVFLYCFKNKDILLSG
jgi:O-antigen/teichoic acid export membrane protein